MQTVDAREQMIEQQVRAWDVLDERVLGTLRKVPRERFVPESQEYLAFADVEVPLPSGQHMLRPSVVGRLLQALALTGNEQVLEIGTGSGFVTACLGVSAAQVRSLEIFPELMESARASLAACEVRNIELVTADATQHDMGGARFDAIAVTASIPTLKSSPWGGFERYLAIGGRLFVVVGDPPVMEAQLVRRIGESSFTSESLFETVIDPLVNAHRPPTFRF
jgi:protein-L-isoaspartate(D-aspartate) O-methyltransferase